MDQTNILQIVGELRDQFEATVADCVDQVLLKTELAVRTRDVRARLGEVLDPSSRAYRVFERLSVEIGTYVVITHDDDPRPYAEARECAVARKWLELLNRVACELDPAASARERDRYVLPAGDVYEAVRKVLRVMKLAQRTLDIVDPYLDDVVFDLIDAIDDRIALRLLTGPAPKPIFIRLHTLLKAKRATVEARATATFHDRFVVLDRNEVWHLGASINGLGKATSLMSRITEKSEAARLVGEFDAAWTSASIL